MKIKPNHHISVLIASAVIVEENNDVGISVDGEILRTELDSHSNIIVVGQHASIISNIVSTAEVVICTPDNEALQKVTIVDDAILYMCPYTDKPYILIVRNYLSVPSKKQNVLPPLSLRESGVQFYSTPRIQSKYPTYNDHSIYFSVMISE